MCSIKYSIGKEEKSDINNLPFKQLLKGNKLKPKQTEKRNSKYASIILMELKTKINRKKINKKYRFLKG